MAEPAPKIDKVIRITMQDRLKQILVNEGVITKEKLRVAEIEAQREKEPLRKTLITLGFVTEEQIIRLIEEKMNIPHVDIKNYTLDRKVLELITEKIARRYEIIPLFKIENVLTVAMSDPFNIVSLDDMSAITGYKVEPVVASQESIKVAIDQWYGIGNAQKTLIEELIDDIETAKEIAEQEARGIIEIHLKKEADEPPIVKMVNSFIVQAVLEGASDIHLEPKKDYMTIRFRIDGFLYNRHQILASLAAPVTARIKIMSGMDISNRRIPQDGRVNLTIRDRKINIRTSTFPSMYGENVVLRILDKTRGTPKLSELGFSGKDLNAIKKLILATKGIILATGPTGCGKTTTIYSAINDLTKSNKNIMTIEDPIEYEIEGIVQSQINLKAGVTFADSLRSILRQDPDIIYVGEIRDLETAEIAVRAALTGHLVLSTIHTNDAVGAIVRLVNIGVDPSLVASVVNYSFAQRLVRRVCKRCAQEIQPDVSLLKRYGIPPEIKYYKGEGCNFCLGSGYLGRIGIYEILIIDKDIRRLITNRASEDEIIKTAREKGMKTLLEDGLLKVTQGITTLDEILRVTIEET